MMRTIVLAILCFAGITPCVLAGWSGNFTASTNYLWRGKSYSENRPVIQGGMDYERGSFSGGTWISSSQGNGGEDNNGVEADFYGRYTHKLGRDWFAHVGGITYHYPHKGSDTYGRWYGGIGCKHVTLEYSRWDYNSTEYRLLADLKGYELMIIFEDDYFNEGEYTYYSLDKTFSAGKMMSLGVHLGYTDRGNETAAGWTSHYDYMLSLNQEIKKNFTATVFYSDTDRERIGKGHIDDSTVGFAVAKTW